MNDLRPVTWTGMRGSQPVNWSEEAEKRRIIWDAVDGNVQDLADRLREGVASREEMAFAADLIEGKVKSRRPRPGQPMRSTNDQIAQAVFQFRATHKDWQQKKIKAKVADMFGVKVRSFTTC